MKTPLTCLMSVAFFALPLPELAAQRADRSVEKLDAERLEQSGTAITIIFDDSGSMGGRKLTSAKEAFRGWIRSAPADYRFRLVTLNGGQLVAFGRNNKAALLSAVDKIEATGGTPLVRNISEAIATVDRRRQEVGPYERQIILVFTDGQESSSAGSSGVRQQLEQARARHIETVGIGFAGDGDYMASTVTRYSNANDGEQLKRSLAKVDAEIGDTLDVVIDPEVLTLMKTAVPEPATPVAVAASAVDEPARGVAAAKPVSSPFIRFGNGTLLIVLFGLFFLGRAALKISRR
jgi:Mg-chelatase subunit ChlD